MRAALAVTPVFSNQGNNIINCMCQCAERIEYPISFRLYKMKKLLTFTTKKRNLQLDEGEKDE